MNRRVFSLLGIALCAVVASAGALAMRKVTPERPAPPVAPPPKPLKAAEAVTVPTAAGQQEPRRQPPSHDIPEHVVYWHLFHHHNFLNKKADEAERNGQDGSHLRDFYKREAKLDEAHAAAFRQVAAECEIEVMALDAEARAIIEKARAKYDKGQLKKGEALPPPPAELAALQERRDGAILKAREKLQTALGEAAFEGLHKFVREKVAPQIKPKSLESLRPPTPGGGPRKPKNDPFAGKN